MSEEKDLKDGHYPDNSGNGDTTGHSDGKFTESIGDGKDFVDIIKASSSTTLPEVPLSPMDIEDLDLGDSSNE